MVKVSELLSREPVSIYVWILSFLQWLIFSYMHLLGYLGMDEY